MPLPGALKVLSCVTGVGNDRLSVLQFAVRSPHFPRVANHRWHGGIDDHVAGDVQIGDAFIGVDHRQRRPLLVHRLNVGFDGGPLIVGQGFKLSVEVTQTVIGIDAQFFECLRMFLEHVLEKYRHCMTEDLGVRDLHHGCFQMD